MVNAQATVANTSNNVTSSSYLGSGTGTTNNLDVLFKRNAISAGRLATTFTTFGLNSVAMPSSVSFGVNAGQFSSGVGSNTYIGQNAGKGQSSSILNSGIYNTFLGFQSGAINSSGSSNTFLGSLSGGSNSTGANNTYIGFNSGSSNSTSNNNVQIGYYSGEFNNGNNNVFIGTQSAGESSGASNCVVIGQNAGYFLNQSNKLIIDYVDNTQINNNPQPLIWGDFSADQLKFNGKVGIGGNSTTGFGNYPTTASGVNVSNYQLFVKGGILTEEVRVSLASSWADYVFNKDYKLKPLSEVEKFIKENGHLPNVPSAAQVKDEGIEIGNMATIQQEKIEELTLYIIEQSKEIEKLKTQVKEIEDLKKLLTTIMNKK